MKKFMVRWGQLALFLVFVAACFVDTSRWTGSLSALPRVAGVIGALFLTHRYTRRHFKQEIDNSHFHSTLKQVSPDRASQLQDEVTANELVTFAQADVFARVFVEASEIQKRIIEQYQPERRTLRQKVTVDIEIPHSTLRRIQEQGNEAGDIGKRSTLYFPVLVPPKGVLYDDLKVYSANDGELPTLAYRQYAKVASSVLHLLLAAACFTRPDELPPGARDCEVDAIKGIISRVDPRLPTNGTKTHTARTDHRFRPPERSDAATLASAGSTPNSSVGSIGDNDLPDGRSLAKTIRNLADVSDADPSCRQAIRLAANLIKVLSSHYAIVVEIPATASGRFTLEYECTLIPELDLETGREHGRDTKESGKLVRTLRSWRAALETLLGARPVNIKISLDNAWACQSYHVIVRSSENLYVSRQELSLPSPDYLDRLAKNAPTAPHIRFRRRLGQSYAHFYARYLSEPRTIVVTEVVTDGDGEEQRRPKDGKQPRKEKAPKLTLDFAEVPPGSLCRAALAAIAAAALVWIIGYALAHLHGGVLSTDVPVLILAFPGVAASWLGFDSSTPDLFEGPLTARLSLACTTLVSLLATMLYVEPSAAASRVQSVGAHHAEGLQMSILGIADWRWWTLVIVAIFNACYLTYRWLLNAWRFRDLGARPDPAGLGIKAYEDLDEEGDLSVKQLSAATTAKTHSSTSSAVVSGIHIDGS